MKWEEIKTPEEWQALPESEKREITREILEEALGLPVNEQRQKTIEGILNSLHAWPGNYPREDKCRYCGGHIGWIANELGEMFALGVCDKKECQEKAKAEARQ